MKVTVLEGQSRTKPSLVASYLKFATALRLPVVLMSPLLGRPSAGGLSQRAQRPKNNRTAARCDPDTGVATRGVRRGTAFHAAAAAISILKQINTNRFVSGGTSVRFNSVPAPKRPSGLGAAIVWDGPNKSRSRLVRKCPAATTTVRRHHGKLSAKSIAATTRAVSHRSVAAVSRPIYCFADCRCRDVARRRGGRSAIWPR